MVKHTISQSKRSLKKTAGYQKVNPTESETWLVCRLQSEVYMSFESADSSIGLINLDKNTSGKRSAGNRHAAFDEAGAGNGCYNEPRQFSTLPVDEVSPASRKLLRSRGFTLLELLIVIAIIAILASILFPALGRAMKGAKSMTCLNNLKQLFLAAESYCTDYNKVYRVPADIDDYTISKYWNVLLIKTSYIPPAKGCRADDDAPNETPDILKCPGSIDRRGWGYNKSTDYGINDYLSSYYPSDPYVTRYPTERIDKYPGKTCYFGDQVFYTIAPGYPMKPERHMNSHNFVFLDGHAQNLTVLKIPLTSVYPNAYKTYFWRGYDGPYIDYP